MSGAHEYRTFFWFHEAIYTYFLAGRVVRALQLDWSQEEWSPIPSVARALP